MRNVVFLLCWTLAVVQSFQLAPRPSQQRLMTARHGLFDGFINSMEAGYKGGEDSAFSKQKAADEAKRLAKKKATEARKKRGFTELKDVKERTYAKITYDDSNDPPREEKKKLFGLF